MDEKIIIGKLKELLGPARFKHSLRVRDTVVRLSKFHHIDLKKASIAGLLHDVSRYMERPGLLAMAKRLGLKIDPISRIEPKLLHAELSAHIAMKEFGIKDPAILNAIRHHTLGSPKMSTLDKIVYVADHIEEGRTHKGVNKARRLARTDLDMAIAEIATSTIQYLLEKGKPVHPGACEVRNHFLLKNGKKK